MSYRGMISDVDLIETIFQLSLNNVKNLTARRGVVNGWAALSSKGIDKRINAFWATFEGALEERLTAAAESAAELKRQEQYDAQVKVAEQVVLESVVQDVGRYLSGMDTKTSVRYSPRVEQTEEGILITVTADGLFGSTGRKNATGKDVRVLTTRIGQGEISFDHTPSLAIERYGVAIRPLEDLQTSGFKGHTHSFQIGYRVLVPTGMLGTIHAANYK